MRFPKTRITYLVSYTYNVLSRFAEFQCLCGGLARVASVCRELLLYKGDSFSRSAYLPIQLCILDRRQNRPNNRSGRISKLQNVLPVDQSGRPDDLRRGFLEELL